MDPEAFVPASAARAWLEDLLAFGLDDLPKASAASSAGSDPRSVSREEVPAGREPITDPVAALAEIAAEIAACTKCPLHATRQHAVPGQGSATPEVVFVGEAPGADEDASGLAFVGKAGQLLTRMIAAMGLTREEVFIVNVLKCRPPNNRDPAPEECAQCLPFLRRQIHELRPRVLVALGSHAAKNLLATDASVGRLRGRVHRHLDIPVIATYHPAYLLRSPDKKKDAWVDLKLALATIGRSPPAPTP